MLDERHLDQLVDLALSCRPYGSPRWNPAGVKAALRKVQELELGEVMKAVVRAAEDRELVTPGAIGNTDSPVWRERNDYRTKPLLPAEPTTVAQRVTAGAGSLCSICSQHEQRCRELWADDHAFESIDDARRRADKIDPLDVSYRVAELRRLARGFGVIPDD